MIVADTNLICYLFIDGEFTDSSEKVFQKDPWWAAPLLWRSEMRNVLAVSVRKNRLELKTAIEIMAEAERLLKGNEYATKSGAVLELTARSTCSAYDCEFVALARDLQVPLVTNDRRILADFPETAVEFRGFIEQA